MFNNISFINSSPTDYENPPQDIAMSDSDSSSTTASLDQDTVMRHQGEDENQDGEGSRTPRGRRASEMDIDDPNVGQIPPTSQVPSYLKAKACDQLYSSTFPCPQLILLSVAHAE